MSDVSPELPLDQRRQIALGQAQSFNAELEQQAAAVRQTKKLADVASRKGNDSTGAPLPPTARRRR